MKVAPAISNRIQDDNAGNQAPVIQTTQTTETIPALQALQQERRRKGWLLGIIVMVSLLAILISPMFGLTFMTPWDEGSQVIFWQMRVPRTLTAWIVGAGLSLAGLVFQAILRNPLAEPFTLGVAAGASLGAAIYIYWGLTFTLGILSGIGLFAFLGAGIITLLIYSVNFRGGHSPLKLLLMGVILTFFVSSILMLLQSLGKSSSALTMMSWMMGRLSFVSFSELLQVAGIFVIVAGMVYQMRVKLNLLQQGEAVALSRGIRSQRVTGILFLGVSLMTGIFVAVTGPIGFIGMIIPHVARRLFGADHRWLFWATLFLGGLVLVVADMIGTLILKPAEIPVGVVTAILGAPFFLYILLKGQKSAQFKAPKG